MKGVEDKFQRDQLRGLEERNILDFKQNNAPLCCILLILHSVLLHQPTKFLH